MQGKSEQEPTKEGSSKYKIMVEGKLAENWSDFFNGEIIEVGQGVEEQNHTVLICHVRDQAELTGILNWIQNMNLVLLEVTAVKKEKNYAQ